MLVQKSRRRGASLALLASLLLSVSSLTAQTPFRTTTAGNEFKIEGLKGHLDDVPGGRRFRAGAFEEITVWAPIHMPAAGAADPTLQRMVIRFRTNDHGPRLISAELRAGFRSYSAIQISI